MDLHPSESFKALQSLTRLKEEHPELRLGQILWNAMGAAGKWEAPEANALFFIQDDELAKILQTQRKKSTKRGQ